MNAGSDLLAGLMASGPTEVCRCWALSRRDGLVLGFTDHDRDLAFDGIDFVADTGLSARMLEQTTGLAVDNSEALGILSHAAVTEADIDAGRYDDARIEAWLVSWSDISARRLIFRGTIGSIERRGGAFQAELRGLTEGLNQPQGRVFHSGCSAVLGDADCGFDLGQPGFSQDLAVETIAEGKFLDFTQAGSFDDRWFERGRLAVLTGAAAGLTGLIKNDRLTDDGRRIELWQSIRADIAVGDMVRLVAGCDRRIETCRLKFDNVVNFRGFPFLPGDDWQLAVPRAGGANDGGSLKS